MYLATLLLEVLDKEPSIFLLLSILLTIAVVGYLLCRAFWWSIALFLPLVAIIGFVLTSELREPSIGEAIYAESKAYYYLAYFGWALAVIAPCVGAILSFRKPVIQFKF